MKQLFDISSKHSFYILLGFLILVPFSIAACYILLTFLLIQLLVLAVNVMAHRKDPDAISFPKQPHFYRYLLLYIPATLISTLFSINRLHSLVDNKEFFVYFLVPLFLVVLNTQKRIKLSLTVILAAAVGSSLLGLGQAVIKGISLDHRLVGATSHWMTYSGLLMFPFIFFFIFLFYEKRFKIRVVIGIALIIIMSAILLSLTRSVWVGIFIALGIFIIYYKPKILYLAIPIAIILAFVLPKSVTNRVTSIFDMNNTTNKDRIYMAQIALGIFKDYPLTGVGPNCIEKVYDQYKPAEAQQTNMHLHNNFLHVLAERGLIALLILIVAFVSIIVQTTKRIRSCSLDPPLEKAVAVGSLFAFIGFLIAGFFEYNFGDAEVKFLLFYFISLPFLPFFTLSRENTND
jgi:O-antigen ligase